VPGSFLFTTNAEFVGLVVPTGGGLAVVPGGTVLAEADRLLTSRPGPPGRIAVEVQALTEPVAALTGAEAGVVVTSIERDGPAWGRLMVGDVIEVVDGNDLASLQQWDARILRLTAGETLALRVRRRGEVREVSIEAAAIKVDAAGVALGMSLRRRAGLGTEVTAVQPASVAARAGLLAGDVITLFDDVRAPSPSQITRSFASLRVGARVMIAGTRGDTHFVTALAR
jgi:S1-C subfamily serine protease